MVAKPIPNLKKKLQFIVWITLCLIHSPITAKTDETLKAPIHELERLINPNHLPNGARSTISINHEDKRLQNCQNPIASAHHAQKLWGKSFLKIQCSNTERKPFFIPVQIDVMGKVAVLAKPVAMGSEIFQDNIEWQERNLTQLPTGWVMSKEEIQGKTARVALMSGQVISPSHLKGQTVIQRGQSVLIQFKGQAFEIKAQVEAMQAAEIGDVIRVKTQSGKILNAVVVAPGEVHLQSNSNG